MFPILVSGFNCTYRGFDVTPITLALSGAAAYPRACQALSSMLSRNALNPADVTVVSSVLSFKHISFKDHTVHVPVQEYYNYSE